MPIGNKAYSVAKGVTSKGYPTHVSNGTGGLYGDLDTEGAEKIGELNQRDTDSWKIPEPTKGRR
jgi:hypothetical protein|tara:strand:+ start:312 stop:503 length:192 start_codon:yes stop_codon:yes gene_type:complete